jgi:hypothetical protein
MYSIGNPRYTVNPASNGRGSIMFAGHLGAALAIGRVERRVNPGVLMFAAMLADFVLWVLVLCGIETVTIPPDFDLTHQARFDFPYSHGLAATLGWSLAAGIAGCLWAMRKTGDGLRVGMWVALAVLSHWFLDALVHAPELPLAGRGSAMVGASLWDRMPLALGIEALIVIAGIALYVPDSGLRTAKKLGLGLLCLVALAFTAAGMTIAPPPPSVGAMAAVSLATIVVVTALGVWLGRNRERTSDGWSRGLFRQ